MDRGPSIGMTTCIVRLLQTQICILPWCHVLHAFVLHRIHHVSQPELC